MEDLHEWAPEYDAARKQVLEAAGIDPSEKHYGNQTVIRIFTAEVPVSLHGDGETQLDCGVGAGGRNVWHVYPLQRAVAGGERGTASRRAFRPVARDAAVRVLRPASGGRLCGPATLAPLDRASSDRRTTAVSFEVGYWTVEDIRARKVWDANWLLRKAKLAPRPPGESEAGDRRKRQLFDAISLVTRKGGEYRGL